VDVLPITSLASAGGAIVIGAAGLWRSRKTDQRDEIADLWTENRALKADVRALWDDVTTLRQEVASCNAEKTFMAERIAELERAL
jgi:hypothetical protein